MLEVSEMLLKKDKVALSRAISMVERRDPLGAVVMKEVFPYTGGAHYIGITGPPGVGKSTLVNALTQVFRANGCSVGIIAVDPTSPMSGGAFLGDRIRMESHYLDPEVFIRSMSSQGSHGGLPWIVKCVVRLFDAAGKDVVLVETVGVGQTQLNISDVADSVVVTLVPDSGDAIQVLKAGLLEIADVFVINKADRSGADHMTSMLKAFIESEGCHGDWASAIVSTRAIDGHGIPELYEMLAKHRRFLVDSSQMEKRRGERRVEELMDLVQQELDIKVADLVQRDKRLYDLCEKVKKGDLEPYSSAMEVFRDMLPHLTWNSSQEQR